MALHATCDASRHLGLHENWIAAMSTAAVRGRCQVLNRKGRRQPTFTMTVAWSLQIILELLVPKRSWLCDHVQLRLRKSSLMIMVSHLA